MCFIVRNVSGDEFKWSRPVEPKESLLRVNAVGSLGPGDRLLVLLHGYGADENDLAPLVQHIDPDGRFTSVCFRAPIDLNPFGAAWYERGADGDVDEQLFKSSVGAIDRTTDAVCEAGGFHRSEMVFIGFSQGCAMTLAVGLGSEISVRPAAMACLSGMLQKIPGYTYDLAAVSEILVQHGTLDPMVDIDRGRQIKEALAGANNPPNYFEYPMGHEISNSSLFDLRDWLATV